LSAYLWVLIPLLFLFKEKPMKSLTAFSVILILCTNSSAQTTYFNGGFGYGFPVGDIVGITRPNNVEKNVYGSFGKGLTLGLNIGHNVTDNISLDLGIWYVTGSTYEFIAYYGSAIGYSTHLVSGKTTRVMPCLKIASGNNKLYAKFGFLLGIGTTINDDETFTASSQTGGSTLATHEFTGGFSNGWTGAIGIDFSENQTASLFVEMNFCQQLYKPVLETINISGQNPQTYHLVDDPNPSASDEKLKPSFVFSTIGLTAGVKFSSSTKKKAP
jgi:hypothetical protein